MVHILGCQRLAGALLKSLRRETDTEWAVVPDLPSNEVVGPYENESRIRLRCARTGSARLRFPWGPMSWWAAIGKSFRWELSRVLNGGGEGGSCAAVFGLTRRGTHRRCSGRAAVTTLNCDSNAAIRSRERRACPRNNAIKLGENKPTLRAIILAKQASSFVV